MYLNEPLKPVLKTTFHGLSNSVNIFENHRTILNLLSKEKFKLFYGKKLYSVNNVECPRSFFLPCKTARHNQSLTGIMICLPLSLFLFTLTINKHVYRNLNDPLRQVLKTTLHRLSNSVNVFEIHQTV